MSEDEFTKLFKYMKKEFTVIHRQLDETATKSQVNALASSVDGLAGLIKEYHQEMIMLTRKVDRMERWIHEIAEKTGVKLSYE